MHIVEVIPLTLLPPNVPQILSYFFDPEVEISNASGKNKLKSHYGAGSELPKGAVVEIGINKRKVKAVVISSTPIEKAKLSLKKVDFQIKKITQVLYGKPQVNDNQLKIALWISKYYNSPLGYTLKTIIPSFAFKKKFPVTVKNKLAAFQVPDTIPRLLIYKTSGVINHINGLIKEKLGGQVLILVPEKNYIRYFSDFFSKNYAVSEIFSGLPNQKLYNEWQKIESGESRMIIGTRQALNMNFSDLKLIIIEDPLHEFYKSDMVPRYNAVNLAHKVAEMNGSEILLTSVVPGVDNYHKIKSKTLNLLDSEPRPAFDSGVVDMAQEIKNGNWSPLGKKFTQELAVNAKNNQKILVFSPRRGYAGIVICGNCGSSINCPGCEVAMRTHKSVELILVCHHCNLSKMIPKSCPVCGNHSLKTTGPAGTQKIYDQIKFIAQNLQPKPTVLALDSDIAKNETEEAEIISEILKPGPAILVATQSIFSYRFHVNFDSILITNADALTNIPDFKSEESLFYQIEKLVSFSPKKISVQTYNPGSKILAKAINGEYESFYEDELKNREAFDYPPFYKIIKLTFRHKQKDKASYAARITTEKLKMAIARSKLGEEVKIVEASPAFIEKEKNLYNYNIFLKVRADYPHTNELLKYAGPGWIIDVEPRSLL